MFDLHSNQVRNITFIWYNCISISLNIYCKMWSQTREGSLIFQYINIYVKQAFFSTYNIFFNESHSMQSCYLEICDFLKVIRYLIWMGVIYFIRFIWKHIESDLIRILQINLKIHVIPIKHRMNTIWTVQLNPNICEIQWFL